MSHIIELGTLQCEKLIFYLLKNIDKRIIIFCYNRASSTKWESLLEEFNIEHILMYDSEYKGIMLITSFKLIHYVCDIAFLMIRVVRLTCPVQYFANFEYDIVSDRENDRNNCNRIFKENKKSLIISTDFDRTRNILSHYVSSKSKNRSVIILCSNEDEVDDWNEDLSDNNVLITSDRSLREKCDLLITTDEFACTTIKSKNQIVVKYENYANCARLFDDHFSFIL